MHIPEHTPQLPAYIFQIFQSFLSRIPAVSDFLLLKFPYLTDMFSSEIPVLFLWFFHIKKQVCWISRYRQTCSLSLFCESIRLSFENTFCFSVYMSLHFGVNTNHIIFNPFCTSSFFYHSDPSKPLINNF